MTTETVVPAGAPQPDDLFTPRAQKPKERDYFGEITKVDTWQCVIRKTGKVKYDPNQHDPTDMLNVVTIQLEWFAQDGRAFTQDQEETDDGPKWAITRSSLIKLGITTRPQLLALKGKYAHIKQAPTGRMYWPRDVAVGDRTKENEGLKKPEMALAFVELYPDRAASDTAKEAYWESRRAAPANSTAYKPAEVADLPSDLGAGQPAMSGDQLFALTMAKALWKASGQDRARFETVLAQNPMITKHFGMLSPEIIQIMSGIDPVEPF